MPCRFDKIVALARVEGAGYRSRALSFQSTMRPSGNPTSPCPASYNVDELVIWRTRPRNVEHAVLPASNSRPNPAVTDKCVFFSLFSAGMIWALDRRTGKTLWLRKLGKFCGDSVYVHDNALFAQTANTLCCLDPKTGTRIWSFSPYGPVGETIYSSPVIQQEQLFIGDRGGFLNCLDARTGRVIWRHLTNDSDENVNSTPIVVKGRVCVATNARTALGYSMDGKLQWKADLDGPSTGGLFEYRGMVGVAADSLYLLNPASGRVRKRFLWKGDQVSHVDKSPREIVLQLRGCWPPRGGSNIMVLDGSRLLRRSYRRGFCLGFRFAEETGLMYESHLDGINAFHPRSARTLFEIRLKNPDGVGLVEVKDKVIYAATGSGYVFGLRHPALM